jgi:hypothetical protein
MITATRRGILLGSALVSVIGSRLVGPERELTTLLGHPARI